MDGLGGISMGIERTSERLFNASIYVKNAILELKNIPCECTEDIGCWRCDLIDDTKNIRKSINDEIQERFL